MNVFTLDGVTHKAVPTRRQFPTCKGCAFDLVKAGSDLNKMAEKCKAAPPCVGFGRKDGRDIVWVEVK